MKTLLERDLNPDPIRQFATWYAAARRHEGILQAEAMCLSTLSPDGFPAGRMVLLKEFGPKGFVFYTNFKSSKAQSLLLYPKAALTFFWETMERQVRIVGNVDLVSEEEADAYFASRPRLSQVGAWASHQSEKLKNRGELDRRFAAYKKKFAGKSVPRPPHWGGFLLDPSEIELWQGRPNRLHDRLLYLRRGKRWKIVRLNP